MGGVLSRNEEYEDRIVKGGGEDGSGDEREGQGRTGKL